MYAITILALMTFAILLPFLFDVYSRIRCRLLFSRLVRWSAADSPKPTKVQTKEALGSFQRWHGHGWSRSEFDDVLCCLDDLCDCYLSDSTDRELIRAGCAQTTCMSETLLTYSRLCGLRLAKLQGREEKLTALRRGLAALSMEDGKREFRYNLAVLERLRARSLDAGLNPSPAIDEITRISSKSDGAKMRRFFVAIRKQGRPISILETEGGSED